MTITARELARQRRATRRERERDYKKQGREKLRRLREHLRHAKKHRGKRLRYVIKLCRAARGDLRERAKLTRAKHRAEAQAEIDAAKRAARDACESRKEMARQKAIGAAERAALGLAEELRYQRGLAIAVDPDPLKRGGGRARAGRRRAEAAAESEAEVSANLPAELLPVWQAVKRKIKETPRRTRTESFLEWAAEHPGEVQRIIDAEIEKDVERLIAEEAELRGRDLSRYARGLSDAELAEAVGAYDMPPPAARSYEDWTDPSRWPS
jgi:hypothetical protein